MKRRFLAMLCLALLFLSVFIATACADHNTQQIRDELEEWFSKNALFLYLWSTAIWSLMVILKRSVRRMDLMVASILFHSSNIGIVYQIMSLRKRQSTIINLKMEIWCVT